MKRLYVVGSLAERLIEHSVKDVSGCRLWVGHRSYKGYGQIRVDGKTISTHVASWSVFHDMPAKGMYVMHKCDVRNCINIDHLRLGTPKNNTADMLAKGRARKDTWFTSSFSHEDKRTMRAMILVGYKQREVAVVFGVKQSCISRLLRKE